MEHKLRYIWRQFGRAETSLKSSLESLEQLRKQHAEEMIEVENYVTHIRQLSDEREDLTKDLEAENEQLKAEMEQMKVEREAGAVVSEEVCDMLRDSGMTEISKETNTVKNQVNHLLKERTTNLERIHRLEREVEFSKSEGSSSQSNKKAIEIVERERKEMEEEMSRLRETTKQVKLEMRKMHEKEIEDLTRENKGLKKKLDESQDQFNKDMAVMLKKFEGNVQPQSTVYCTVQYVCEHLKEKNYLKAVKVESITLPLHTLTVYLIELFLVSLKMTRCAWLKKEKKSKKRRHIS